MHASYITVSDLIAQLAKFDPGLPVSICASMETDDGPDCLEHIPFEIADPQMVRNLGFLVLQPRATQSLNNPTALIGQYLYYSFECSDTEGHAS